jgi:hypothetical protein
VSNGILHDLILVINESFDGFCQFRATSAWRPKRAIPADIPSPALKKYSTWEKCGLKSGKALEEPGASLL